MMVIILKQHNDSLFGSENVSNPGLIKNCYDEKAIAYLL